MRRLFTYQHTSTLDKNNKKMKLQPQPLQLVLFSPMSCALVCICHQNIIFKKIAFFNYCRLPNLISVSFQVAFEETGSVLFFRVPPWLNHLGRPQGQLGSLQICQLTQLLLHCLISGCDWLVLAPNLSTRFISSCLIGGTFC